MKNFLIVRVMLTTLPVFAACSLEGDSCSIAEIIKPQALQRTYGPVSSVKEFSETPETKLIPKQNESARKNLRKFGPQTGDYSYNTDCQFGVCNPSGVPQLFEQR